MVDKAGTVETQIGPVKGITLVDPVTGIPYTVGTIILDPSEVEIGKVVIKDDNTNQTAAVTSSAMHVAVQNEVDVNITNASIEIDIDSATGDNISIKDSGGDELDIKADGSIDVNATFSGSSDSYFQDENGTALTGAFVEQTFGFDSITIMILNDENTAGNVIEWSFDGATTHGKLKGKETITMDRKKHPSIYLKGTGFSYRVIVY